jgi:hypothetical protein
MNFLEAINDYLNNALSPSDRRLFEAELAINADLRQAVDEQQQLLAWIKKDKNPLEITEKSAERLDLEAYLMAELAKLPDAPAEKPQKAEITEGGNFPPLQPVFVKKTNRFWWAAAASLALMAAFGIWFFQQKTKPLTTVVQVKPTPNLSVDTLKKAETPKIEDKKVLTNAPKAPPQYPTPQKEEKPIEAVEKFSNEELYADATFSDILNKEESLLRGNSNAESLTTQNLAKGIQLIKDKNPQQAIPILQNLVEERPEAEIYVALAYLLTDRKKGIAILEKLKEDERLGKNRRSRIEALLLKLN